MTAAHAGAARTVTAVICAAFDAATDAAVLEVRERVRALGVRLPDRPPHRPHFSLAAARVPAAELDRVVATAADVAARHAPVPLRLDDVGRFGRAGALWLGPRLLPSAVATLQADADAALRAAGRARAFGERSDPAQWVAHCTLATRLPKPQLRDLQDRLRDGYRAVPARLDALAVILVGGRGDVAHLPLSRPAPS